MHQFSSETQNPPKKWQTVINKHKVTDHKQTNKQDTSYTFSLFVVDAVVVLFLFFFFVLFIYLSSRQVYQMLSVCGLLWWASLFLSYLAGTHSITPSCLDASWTSLSNLHSVPGTPLGPLCTGAKLSPTA